LVSMAVSFSAWNLKTTVELGEKVAVLIYRLDHLPQPKLADANSK